MKLWTGHLFIAIFLLSRVVLTDHVFGPATALTDESFGSRAAYPQAFATYDECVQALRKQLDREHFVSGPRKTDGGDHNGYIRVMLKGTMRTFSLVSAQSTADVHVTVLLKCELW